MHLIVIILHDYFCHLEKHYLKQTRCDSEFLSDTVCVNDILCSLI